MDFSENLVKDTGSPEEKLYTQFQGFVDHRLRSMRSSPVESG